MSLPRPPSTIFARTARLGAMVTGLADAPRAAIARRVTELFNDPARRQPPVQRSDDSLFGANSLAWRVHGDVGAMLIGGVAALLMQMLHPSVLAGVWDHSAFREDMLARLRGTARFIAITTYDTRDAADAAITRVRAIHQRVHGYLPDGSPYDATDPSLLAWVHLSETMCFFAAWRRYVAPFATTADQDRYLVEMATIGGALGATPVPRSTGESRAFTQSMRPQLRVDERTVEVAKLLRDRPGPALPAPMRGLLFAAAFDLLPHWAQQMHADLDVRAPTPLIRAAATGTAATLRWALRR